MTPSPDVAGAESLAGRLEKLRTIEAAWANNDPRAIIRSQAAELQRLRGNADLQAIHAEENRVYQRETPKLNARITQLEEALRDDWFRRFAAAIIEADEQAAKHGGLRDCRDNHGDPYQSQWLDCLISKARDLLADEAPALQHQREGG